MLLRHRVQGIELLDLPRCPRVIRDGALDYLQFIMRVGKAYAPIVPVLAASLARSRSTSIVDCASGGGGPWPELRAALVAHGASAALAVRLTDAYPNLDAYREIARRDPCVTGDATPRDIEHDVARDDAPERVTYTLFSSFHHFAPPTAERVLRNLTAHGDTVFIAEVTERRWRAVLFMLLAPLLVWLATPFLRPVRLSRFVLTYLLPVIPFVVCFDGIVSCLRTYSVDELRALVTTLRDVPYEWRVSRAADAPLAVTCLLGEPRVRER